MNTDVSDRLVSEFRQRSALSEPEIAEMWKLFSHYYGGVNEEQFRTDLSGKTDVVVCRDGMGRIGGFSTIEVFEQVVRGREIGVLFSGDTIISHDFWGRNDLAFSWLRFASKQKTMQPDRPLFWLLIVKGHRTYRYLSAFGRRFYPAPDWPTPPGIQSMIDSLATMRFGDAYIRAQGVVRYPTTAGYLKAPWSVVPENARDRKDVTYFLERNPRYDHGDELVCLCEVSRDNLKPMAKRVFDDVAGHPHAH